MWLTGLRLTDLHGSASGPRHPSSSARTRRVPSTIACSFANASSRARYFMPQSGATVEALRGHVAQGASDPLRDGLRGDSTSAVAEVERTEDHVLGGELIQHGVVEPRLGGLDRDLLDDRVVELAQVRSSRPRACRGRWRRSRSTCAAPCLLRCPRAPGRSPASRVLPGGLRPRLQVRLVDLDHVGARPV